MSMEPHSRADQPEPKPATRDWTPTIAAVGMGMVMVFGLAALAAVKDNGGSITATSPWGGGISVTVLAPQ